MLKGFYALTSGMLTQSKKMTATSNNMGNTATPGYKKETVTSTTFRDQMLYKTGNIYKKNPKELKSTTSTIRIVDGVSTDYSQGSLDETGRVLDFAISGEGFFEIATDNGSVYTRNGSFTLDEDGYLCLPNVGRVVGDGNEIQLETDKIQMDTEGNIYVDGDVAEKLTVTVFDDESKLIKIANGMYNGEEAGAGEPDPDDEEKQMPHIIWKTLERSNVQSIEEMTDMMTTQRALQSSSQLLKMYDQLMGKMVSDIGRL